MCNDLSASRTRESGYEDGYSDPFEISLQIDAKMVKNHGLSKIADLDVPVPFCELGSYCYSDIKIFYFYPL